MKRGIVTRRPNLMPDKRGMIPDMNRTMRAVLTWCLFCAMLLPLVISHHARSEYFEPLRITGVVPDSYRNTSSAGISIHGTGFTCDTEVHLYRVDGE